MPLGVRRAGVDLTFARPRERPAAAGVAAPGHPHLVPVVEAGSAGKGHLQHHRQPQAPDLPAGQGEEARGVVAADQIVRGLRDRPRAAGPQPRQTVRQLPAVDRAGREEPHRQLAQRVVHRRIERIALQPDGRVAHHLAEQVGVRLDRPHHRPQVAPHVRVDVARHVQPPAVDPVVPYPAGERLQQVGARLRIGQVHARHGRHAVPCLVGRLHRRAGVGRLLDRQPGLPPPHRQPLGQAPVRRHVRAVADAQRPLLDHEPVAKLRSAPVPHHVGEGEEARMDVVDRDVQHHPHARLMRRVDQRAQRVVAAEQRVDGQVVDRVVAVVGGRGEDRREIERLDAQPRQIVQASGDAGQVAAPEAARLRRRSPRPHVRRIDRPIAVGETVGKDLVDHRAARPGGHRERRQLLRRIREPPAVEPLDGDGDARRRQIDSLSSSTLPSSAAGAKREGVLGAGAERPGDRLPEGEAPARRDRGHWVRLDLSARPHHQAGVRQRRFGPHAQAEPSIRLAIHERPVARVEADVPGRHVAGQTVDAAIVVMPAGTGGRCHRCLLQPLTAPRTRPPTMCRWANRKVSTIGAAPISAAADRLPHRAE